MEMTSLKMILHALPQDDMMELEQMIDSEKRKMGGGRLTATQGMVQEESRKRSPAGTGRN